MMRINSMLRYAVLSVCLLFSLTALGANKIPMTQSQFINHMVSKHKFNRTSLQQLLNQAKKKDNVIKYMGKPRKPGQAKPKPLAWYKYRRRFITDRHMKTGSAFWQRNAKTLAAAERQFGVPQEVIMGIIGVETIYGEYMGTFRIIDALNTLAFHYPRRAAYFVKELEHYLLMTREQKLNPLKLKGSYAGAMGLGQFMPSSYRKYAIDFDGNGVADIWRSETDAIGSVANYLKAHGWQRGKSVITATQINPKYKKYLEDLGMKPTVTLKHLKQRGALYHGSEKNNTPATIIDLRSEQGMAYWVGFQNFYVITRYNHSKRYAMAVYQLGQTLKEHLCTRKNLYCN